MGTKTKLKILVSSTVYGIEELLERIYTLLNGFGYEVWMSHKGTVPVYSDRSAFENCIKAVEECDLFLSIITPYYGSGIEKNDLSITHKELKKALELNKPRWLLAHDHVVFARVLLNKLGYKNSTDRNKLTLQGNNAFNDLRLIEMYEDAILSDKPLKHRQGNWVQKFREDEDALLFASAQFFRYQEVESFIKENLSNHSLIAHQISENRDRT